MAKVVVEYEILHLSESLRLVILDGQADWSAIVKSQTFIEAVTSELPLEVCLSRIESIGHDLLYALWILIGHYQGKRDLTFLVADQTDTSELATLASQPGISLRTVGKTNFDTQLFSL